MSQSSTRSARLHAATTALGALLLLVALCVMALHHAPWWAQGGVLLVLLLQTAVFGAWLTRWRLERALQQSRGDRQWWADLERAQNARQRRFHAGVTWPEDDDDVFWQERMPRARDEEREENN